MWWRCYMFRFSVRLSVRNTKSQKPAAASPTHQNSLRTIFGFHLISQDPTVLIGGHYIFSQQRCVYILEKILIWGQMGITFFAKFLIYLSGSQKQWGEVTRHTPLEFVSGGYCKVREWVNECTTLKTEQQQKCGCTVTDFFPHGWTSGNWKWMWLVSVGVILKFPADTKKKPLDYSNSTTWPFF